MKRNIQAANQFHSYRRGWADGATHHGIRPEFENSESPDLVKEYLQGYKDGQNAFRLAMVEASKRLDYKPSILRVQ